jgi:hypothetical protein
MITKMKKKCPTLLLKTKKTDPVKIAEDFIRQYGDPPMNYKGYGAMIAITPAFSILNNKRQLTSRDKTDLVIFVMLLMGTGAQMFPGACVTIVMIPVIFKMLMNNRIYVKYVKHQEQLFAQKDQIVNGYVIIVKMDIR